MMTTSHSERDKVLNALSYIPVAQLDYNEWLKIGMALKDASENGEDIYFEDFDQWSQNDDRYDERVCRRKWDSFKRSDGDKITLSTLFDIAQEFGYFPDNSSDYEPLEWDSIIDDGGEDIEKPPEENTWEVQTFIKTLFEPEDNVWFNLERYKDSETGELRLGKGNCRKAKNILDELEAGNSIDDVFTSYKKELGGYIRFNPLDEEGVSDKNVLEYRYCLVESDEIPKNDQVKIIKELQLPCATIVDSGGKSIHAVVRVNANDYKEYRKRVNKIYDELDEHGFKVDRQNINPSRMTRLPGLIRGNKVQKLVATNTGFPTYGEWLEYIDTEYFPIFMLDEYIEDPPDKKPWQIAGFLRRGHKMIVTAPSKAGKTQLMIELTIALAEGGEWLGNKCVKSKVLYADLEIDQISLIHRFKEAYESLGIEPKNANNIGILPLRGKARPVKEFSDILIKQFKDHGYDALVIDPLYKIQDGDENSAQDITKFTNELDHMAESLDLSIIYIHHHSKGPQDNKSVLDRGSGSGVFSRDADAIIDLIEIESDREDCKAYRIESEVREFSDPDTIYVYYDYPIHYLDKEGNLVEASAKRTKKKKKKKKESKRYDQYDRLDKFFEKMQKDNEVVLSEMATAMNMTTGSLTNLISKYNINKWKKYKTKEGKLQLRN